MSQHCISHVGLMYFLDFEVYIFLKMCPSDRRQDYKVFALLKSMSNN
jgi:hypothetical protein